VKEPVASDLTGLLRLMGAHDLDELSVLVDEHADADAWVTHVDDVCALEVFVGPTSMQLAFPFAVSELLDLIDEMDADLEIMWADSGLV
jgi:hypothetical protein